MTENKFPRPDTPEGEPSIANLARWAKATGGIESVSLSVHWKDGRSYHETVNFFPGREDDA